MQAARDVSHLTRDAVQHVVLSIDTGQPMEFVDLTERLREAVAESGVAEGVLLVQSRHTTAGLLVNENEPLLVEDLAEMFQRLVPTYFTYRHDDFHRRTVNRNTPERVNGHAHCRAALLRASEYLPIAGGALALGSWQRVFFVDFDGGQRRQVWLTVLGQCGR